MDTQTKLANMVNAVLSNPSCADLDGTVTVMLGDRVFKNKPKKKDKLVKTVNYEE